MIDKYLRNRLTGRLTWLLLCFSLTACSFYPTPLPPPATPASNGFSITFEAATPPVNDPAIVVEPFVSYKPPIIPITFRLSPNGVSVEGEAPFPTPLGTFALGVEVSPAVTVPANDLILILEDQTTNQGYVYIIDGQYNAHIIVDGNAEIFVSANEVRILLKSPTTVQLNPPDVRNSSAPQIGTDTFRLISPTSIPCNSDVTTERFEWEYASNLPRNYNFLVRHTSPSNPFGTQELRTRDESIIFPVYPWQHHSGQSAQNSFWEVQVLDEQDQVLESVRYAPCR